MRRFPRIIRSHLRPDQILTLIRHRYGSTERFDGDVLSYAEVAKVSGVAPATVRSNIIRFHRNGNRVITKKRPGRTPRIPEELQLKMVASETLTDMRFLPMRVRAQKHSVQFGLRISHFQLKSIYKKHGVRFRQPKLSARLPDEKELALIPERIFFAERMKRLMEANRIIIYADEATFQATARPAKTWMRGERLVAPRNFKLLQNITVYGAVTSALSAPIFLTSSTTNGPEFGRFLDHLIEKTKLLQRPVLILDNHRAHRTSDNLAKMSPHFDVVFQPPYSSEANAQETVWARVKKLYLSKLYRRDENMDTMRHFVTFLDKFLDETAPLIETAQLVKAPHWWLHAH